jgi:hypothetical protein
MAKMKMLRNETPIKSVGKTKKNLSHLSKTPSLPLPQNGRKLSRKPTLNGEAKSKGKKRKEKKARRKMQARTGGENERRKVKKAEKNNAKRRSRRKRRKKPSESSHTYQAHSHSAKTHHLALRSASTRPLHVPLSPILMTVSQAVVSPTSVSSPARLPYSCLRVNLIIF